MTNVFLIHTEYHLMMTIRMIVSCFSKDENYIYYTVGRLKKEQFIETNNYGMIIKPLPAKDYGVRSTLNEMLALNPSNFVVFQDYISDEIYLTYHFHRKKVKVSLVQDGYKPYPIWHRKHLALVVVKETFELYMQMIKRKALIPSLFLRTYKYGALRYIDAFWLEYPDKLPYKTRKSLVQIPTFSQESKSLCFKLFDYHKEDGFDGSVLYVGQPFRKEYLRKKELDIISQIIKNHPDKRFVYKPHPLMSKEQLSEISNLKGVEIYEKAIPIELLMVSIKNSIIVSPWSTALLTYNDSCRYYWLHKFLFEEEKAQKEKQMDFVNPTDYIREIANLDEIV